MTETIRQDPFPISTALLALGLLLLPAAAQAGPIVKTASAGAYTATLKVLPPESFAGPDAPMVWDRGAPANRVEGPEHPNHHLVVFIKENGKPVERAKVEIRYRNLSSKRAGWKVLPVARMHEAGAGLKSTHFGNNVRLASGRFEVRVTVNGQGPATFHFSL